MRRKIRTEQKHPSNEANQKREKTKSVAQRKTYRGETSKEGAVCEHQRVRAPL